MPRQDFFVLNLLPSPVKCYLNSQNFPPYRGKNSVMMTLIVRLSSDRSYERINQNARITWVIMDDV